MPKSVQEKEQDVSNFTVTVQPLVDILNEAFSSGSPENDLHISDVRDVLDRQCVDLVQEGGGVHGIALAGYTYILEKMNISFIKMAGTSAGAINTVLLHSVLSKNEVELIARQEASDNYNTKQLGDNNYYDTRSEKLLEYLADKDIGDFIDGHPRWRTLLLNLFQGKVDYKIVKKEKKLWTRNLLLTGIFLLIFILSGIFIFFGQSDNPYIRDARVAGGISFILFILLLGNLIARAWQGRIMWYLSEKLGINPGNNFESWIQKDILEKNGIYNVNSLREKLELENTALQPQYCLPRFSDQKPKSDYKLTAPHQNELNYRRETDKIADKLDSWNNERPESKDVEILWDRLMRLAANLIDADVNDASIEHAEEIAQDRIKYVTRLFERIIPYQDQACNYVANINDQTGPYHRELTVITTDINNQMKVEFPAMHKLYWGHDFSISPASYVRASMAIPFFFTPYRVMLKDDMHDIRDQEWKTWFKVVKRMEGEEIAQFVDGGAISNFPINIYATPEMPMPRKPTLGVKLEFEDDTISEEIGSVGAEVGSIISTMRYFYDRDFIAKNDMFRRTVRSIDTGNISWLNFALTPEEKQELFYRGALAAVFFLIHSHQQFAERGEPWITRICSAARAVQCAHLRKEPFDFMTGFKYEGQNDVVTGPVSSGHNAENVSQHFNWQDYKEQRLLAITRTRYQRSRLKKFPK